MLQKALLIFIVWNTNPYILTFLTLFSNQLLAETIVKINDETIQIDPSFNLEGPYFPSILSCDNDNYFLISFGPMNQSSDIAAALRFKTPCGHTVTTLAFPKLLMSHVVQSDFSGAYIDRYLQELLQEIEALSRDTELIPPQAQQARETVPNLPPVQEKWSLLREIRDFFSGKPYPREIPITRDASPKIGVNRDPELLDSSQDNESLPTEFLSSPTPIASPDVQWNIYKYYARAIIGTSSDVFSKVTINKNIIGISAIELAILLHLGRWIITEEGGENIAVLDITTNEAGNVLRQSLEFLNLFEKDVWKDVSPMGVPADDPSQVQCLFETVGDQQIILVNGRFFFLANARPFE